jgi:hypothetical protein
MGAVRPVTKPKRSKSSGRGFFDPVSRNVVKRDRKNPLQGSMIDIQTGRNGRGKPKYRAAKSKSKSKSKSKKGNQKR